jgi:hypothetical protein
MAFELPPLRILDLAFLAGCMLLIHLSRRWVLLYALLAWPGTLLHELSHWLIAAVLGGRPTVPSIVPTRTERGWRLGSVGIRHVRWFNALPIGSAPLLLAPLAIAALVTSVRWPASHWAHWFALYVAAAAALACLPSLADWKIVGSRPLGLVFYAAVLAAGCWLRLGS